MLNLGLASAYVRQNGSPADLARLAAIEAASEDGAAGYGAVMTGQRHDGGFAPFWVAHYSSVDATAFRLWQVRPLDMAGERTATARAVRFLASRQRDDGTFEEDPSVAALARSWARPGDPSARLYLTANAGFMLAIYRHRAEAGAAVGWVDREVQRPGAVLSPAAQWLAAALLWTAARTERASVLLAGLEPRLPDMEGDGLAWCLTSLLEAGLRPDFPILAQAWSLLETRQRPDGSFDSLDGDAFTVQATLGVIQAAVLRARNTV
ncbi:MAG: hypothetical protein ACP5QO_03150 [Clostridia bacterium]